ncbi:hypothetical protein Tco_0995026 [Tanacetum coccineum]
MRLSFLSNAIVEKCTAYKGSVHDFDFRPFNTIIGLQVEEDGQFGKMCIQNGYNGSKLFLHNRKESVANDDLNDIEEFRKRAWLRLLLALSLIYMRKKDGGILDAGHVVKRTRIHLAFGLRNEISHLEKKLEIELWLENNGSVDSFVSSDNEIEEEVEED